VSLTESMTAADWIRVLQEGRDENCKSVQFIGGEPLLHPDLELLIRIVKLLGYENVEVFTNGTLVTSQFLQTCAELGINLAFSFYSSDPEIHDSITGRKGSYQRTLRAVDSALEHGLSVRVGIIQINQSRDEIERTKMFLKSRGVVSIGVDRMRKVGRADANGSYQDPEVQLQELCGACHNGKLCVTATGTCYPCIMARSWPVGDIRNGLSSIVHGESLAIFRKRQRVFLKNTVQFSCRFGCNHEYSPVLGYSSLLKQNQFSPETFNIDRSCYPEACSSDWTGCNPDVCIPQCPDPP
jgi:MoaA/NifB/PqqE/SkfB family radical SAM enzyme